MKYFPNILQYVYLLTDYLLVKERRMADSSSHEWDPEYFDFYNEIKMQSVSWKLLEQTLQENGLSILLENQQAYCLRTGDDRVKFTSARYPAFASPTDQGKGKIYILFAIIEDVCYIYVGKYFAVRAHSRKISRRHISNNRTGWEDFCQERGITTYYEDLIYFNNEENSMTDPLAETSAIDAFFLLQNTELNVTI
jgi:hypothetical protein